MQGHSLLFLSYHVFGQIDSKRIQIVFLAITIKTFTMNTIMG